MRQSPSRETVRSLGSGHQLAAERVQVHPAAIDRDAARQCRRRTRVDRGSRRMQRAPRLEGQRSFSPVRTARRRSNRRWSRPRIQPVGRGREQRPYLRAQPAGTRLRLYARSPTSCSAILRIGHTRRFTCHLHEAIQNPVRIPGAPGKCTSEEKRKASFVGCVIKTCITNNDAPVASRGLVHDCHPLPADISAPARGCHFDRVRRDNPRFS